MSSIEKLITFAQEITIECEKKMIELQHWESYIKPLFLEKFGYEYRLEYASLYKPECQDWLKQMRFEFKNK